MLMRADPDAGLMEVEVPSIFRLPSGGFYAAHFS
jgi:hypothetical protein